jgi:hypothetical protein
MNNRIMSDRNITPDLCFCFLVCTMDHSAILNICIISNGNGMDIPTDNRVEPHCTIVAHANFTYYNSGLSQITVVSETR